MSAIYCANPIFPVALGPILRVTEPLRALLYIRASSISLFAVLITADHQTAAGLIEDRRRRLRSGGVDGTLTAKSIGPKLSLRSVAGPC